MSEKKHGFMDKILHPKGEEESPGASAPDASEESQPVAKDKRSAKSSVKAGASSESKHHQRKFDKFKKGN